MICVYMCCGFTRLTHSVRQLKTTKHFKVKIYFWRLPIKKVYSQCRDYCYSKFTDIKMIFLLLNLVIWTAEKLRENYFVKVRTILTRLQEFLKSTYQWSAWNFGFKFFWIYFFCLTKSFREISPRWEINPSWRIWKNLRLRQIVHDIAGGAKTGFCRLFKPWNRWYR